MVKKETKKGSDRERYEVLINTRKDIVKNIRDVDTVKKLIKGISPKPIDDILNDSRLTKRRILTNTALDRILSYNGGIELGSSVEFYGAFASGKTQICETLVAEAEGLIIYIDGEHTFRPRRLVQICEARGKDVKEVASRLLLYQPSNWIEQEGIIANLPEYDDNDNFLDVGLIVMDSLMVHWGSAPEFYGRDRNSVRQQLIRTELQDLVAYARRHNGVFVFTNQIMAKPVDTTMLPPEEKVADRGGPTVEHFADYRIFLRKGFGSVRFARVVDCIDLPLLEVPFVLDTSGILDIPDPVERARAAMSSADYINKFGSGKSGSKEAGEDYKLFAVKLGYITPEEGVAMGLDEKKIQKVLDERQSTYEDRLRMLSEEEKGILDDEESGVESEKSTEEKEN